MSRFLFLESDVGECRELLYASCVAKEIASAVRRLGHEVVEVEKPSPSDANAAIMAENPDVVWWVGHGNTEATTLEDVELWIRKPDLNTEILNGRTACALSCSTGPLGRYLTETKKCNAYMGYNDLFYFAWCESKCGMYYNCACQGTNPWGVREEVWVELVKSMHEATLHFVLGLAQGKNAGDAYRLSMDRFLYWIQRFEAVEPESGAEASVIAMTVWSLQHDMSCQVLHGEPRWGAPLPPRRKMLPLLAGIAAGGAAGYLTGNPVIGLGIGTATAYITYKT